MKQFEQKDRNNYYSNSNPMEVRFIQAASRNNFAEVKKIVEGHNIYIDVKNEFGSTALALSALHQNIEMMNFLVYKGANLEATNNVGMTALLHASSQNKVDSVEELISLGADLKAVDGYKRTVLTAATGKGADLVVDYLLHELNEDQVTIPEDVFSRTVSYRDYSNTGDARKVVRMLCSTLGVDWPTQCGGNTGYTIHLGPYPDMTLRKQKLWDQSDNNKEVYKKLLQSDRYFSSDSALPLLKAEIIEVNDISTSYKGLNFFLGGHVLSVVSYFAMLRGINDIGLKINFLTSEIREQSMYLEGAKHDPSMPKLIELDKEGTIFDHPMSFYGGFASGKLFAKPIIKYTNDRITHSNEGKSFVSYFAVDMKDMVQMSASLLTYNFVPNSCSIAEKIIVSKVVSDVSVNEASFSISYASSVVGQVVISYAAFAGLVYTGQYHLLEKNSAVVGLVVSTAPDLVELGYNSVTEMYNYLSGTDSTTEGYDL